MINIKIIILFSLVAYVACGGGFSKAKVSDVSTDESSDSSSLSENGDDASDSKEKEISNDGENIPKPAERDFSNFGNQDANIMEGGNLIGNPNVNFERTADGFKINGRNVPGVNPYNAIEIDWNPQGGIAVNGEDKTGFEDMKYSGKTLLEPITNPSYTDGTGPSEALTEGNPHLHFDTTGDGIKVNSQEVTDTGSRQGTTAGPVSNQAYANGAETIPPKHDVGDQRLYITDDGIKTNSQEVTGIRPSEESTEDKISYEKNDDYHCGYQECGRQRRKPTIPTDNAIRMKYDDFMNPSGNTNGFNNKRNGKVKTTNGDQEFSRNGVGKEGLGVEFTDDGVLVNGKRAPKYDVENERVNVDMTGDEIMINGQEVTDTGLRKDSKKDKKWRKKNSYSAISGIGLVNSNNVNSNNLSWNNRRGKNYNKSTNFDFNEGGSSRYNTSNTIGGQYNSSNRGVQNNTTICNSDVQFNNFGDSDLQFSHQSNGCIQNFRGNRENAVFTQNGNIVKFKDGALLINNKQISEIEADDVKQIKFIGEGSVKINGMKVEGLGGIREAGTINFF